MSSAARLDAMALATDERSDPADLVEACQPTSGLRLVATDLDWSTGDGPEVRGTGEALIMGIAGRRTPLDDLDGPGLDRLRPSRG